MIVGGLLLSDKDLTQRFTGTFMKIRSPSIPEGVYYIGDFEKGRVQIDGKNSRAIHSHADLEIVKDFPEMGAVNYNGDVHFLTRFPLRQWSRGLSQKLIDDFCRRREKSFRQLLTIDGAKACFDRVYIPLEEGLSLLKRTHFSFAISPHYWLSGRNKTYLWRDTTCLGEILGNKLFAFPSVCIMRNEINAELGGCYEIV